MFTEKLKNNFHATEELKNNFHAIEKLKNNFHATEKLKNNFHAIEELKNNFHAIEKLKNNFHATEKLKNNFHATEELKNNFCATEKLKNNFHATEELKNNFHATEKLKNNFHATEELKNNFHAIEKLKNNFHATEKLKNNFHATEKLKNNFHATEKLKNNFHATEKLKNNFHATEKLKNNFHATEKLKNNFHATEKLKNNFHAIEKLKNNFHATEKLKNNFHATEKLKNNFHATEKLKNNFHATEKLKNNFHAIEKLKNNFHATEKLKNNFCATKKLKNNFCAMVMFAKRLTHTPSKQRNQSPALKRVFAYLSQRDFNYPRWIGSNNKNNTPMPKMNYSWLFIIFLQAIFLIGLPLHAIFSGKQKDEDTFDKWVLVKNASERKLAFTSFQKIDEIDEVLADFHLTLPRTLAGLMEKTITIEVPSDDFVGIEEKRKYYDLKTFPIPSPDDDGVEDEVSESGEQISDEEALTDEEVLADEEALTDEEVLTDEEALTDEGSANDLEEAREKFFEADKAEDEEGEGESETETEKNEDTIFDEDEQNPTNEQTDEFVLEDVLKEDEVEEETFETVMLDTNFAFARTNMENNRYEAYMYKYPKEQYIDPNLFTEWQVESLVSDGVDIGSNQSIGYYIPEDSNPKKTLNILQEIYVASDEAALDKLFDEKGVDYFVHGTFRQLNNKEIRVSLYLVNNTQKTISFIISRDVRLFQIREDLNPFVADVVNFLQKKQVVEEVIFLNGVDAGRSLLYLDGVYKGILPLKLKDLNVGEYAYRVWNEDYILTAENSLIEKDASGEVVTNSGGEIVRKLTISEETTQISFDTERITARGNINISISNDVPADFYLDSQLVGKNTKRLILDLQEGDYFLKVEKEGYETYLFPMPVRGEAKTDMLFAMNPVKEVPKWRQKLFNHHRNARIFWSLGFVTGAISMVSYMETLDLEDRKNEFRERVESSEYETYNAEMTEYYAKLQEDYDRSLGLSAGLFFGLTMPFFLLATVSYVLDIYLDRAKIETQSDMIDSFGMKITGNLSSLRSSLENKRR